VPFHITYVNYFNNFKFQNFNNNEMWASPFSDGDMVKGSKHSLIMIEGHANL
jgi:hypothetical protein